MHYLLSVSNLIRSTYLVTLNLNEFFSAVHNVEIEVVVVVRHVSSVEPAFAVNGFLGGFLVVPVAFHYLERS